MWNFSYEELFILFLVLGHWKVYFSLFAGLTVNFIQGTFLNNKEKYK